MWDTAVEFFAGVCIGTTEECFGGISQAGGTSGMTFANLVDGFLDIISLLIPVVIGLTAIVFMWGLVRGWILNAGDDEGVTRGKNVALIGIIVLVVMIGLWGILGLVRSALFGG